MCIRQDHLIKAIQMNTHSIHFMEKNMENYP